MNKTEAKQRAEMFFFSESDNSWWMHYKTDKPNKFIGGYENLPIYVRRLRYRYGAWR